MAGPPAILLMLAKKYLIDLLLDPEKFIKFVLYCLLIILALLLFLVLPIILILSIPSILFSAGNDSISPDLLEKQIKTIAIYQDVPNIINERNLEWIDHKKEQYSWCDSFRVEYDYNLTWHHLMSIDSVLLEQDFNKADKDDVLKLGENFLIKKVRVETYKVKRKDHWVTKHRAIITIKTKTYDQVLEELGFNDFEKGLAINIYNTISSADIEGNLNIYDDVDLSDLKEYPPGSANIPYFNQADMRWGNESYGSTTIKSGGCGPTSLAMVLAGLTGRSDINPKTVADWSVANGYRAEGAGSYWSLMTAGGRNYGLSVEAVSRMNPNKIVQALSQGHPVIAAMGRGHFTNGGHFIVLRGITSDGKILVYDSASVARSKAWDIGIIMNESSTNGGVNGSPFWIFK